MTEEPTYWTPKALLEWTEGYFRDRGVPTPRLDAELLLAHVLGVERIRLYLEYDRPVMPSELERYRELVRARGRRRPVAYLVGEVGFWKLDLHINEDCLIPSPDTETLVEGVLEAIGSLRTANPDRPLQVLELGTGSGAIPLAVLSEAERVRWVGLELSGPALRVAAANRQRHAALLAPRHNALHLVRGDRFEPLRPAWRPDVIAGNPPYIPTGTIDRLLPEVSRAEPRLALDGGRDGMDFLRYMLAWAGERLAPGGHVLFEMGAEQSREASRLVGETPGLALVGVHRDLVGHPRVLHARHTGE